MTQYLSLLVFHLLIKYNNGDVLVFHDIIIDNHFRKTRCALMLNNFNQDINKNRSQSESSIDVLNQNKEELNRSNTV